MTLVKAEEGLEVRTRGFVGLTISLDVITAEAWVSSKKEIYLELARKVISPFLASLIPATPVMETSALPTTSPPTSSAIFFNSRLLRDFPLFFLCVGIIQSLGHLIGQVTAFTLINQHTVIKDKRVTLVLTKVLDDNLDFL